MSFDKFLLAVGSRDLSQADKSIIRVSSFPKMSDGKQKCQIVFFWYNCKFYHSKTALGMKTLL